MSNLDKPSAKNALIATWVAISIAIGFGFMIAAGVSPSNLLTYAITLVFCIYPAIHGWKNYFELYTQYQIKMNTQDTLKYNSNPHPSSSHSQEL